MKYKEWNTIPWNNIQNLLYDLQSKIYNHAKNNEIGLTRYYQHKLIRSEEARLLAVRKISQDNRGKATAGIDNVSKLTQKQRLKLARKLIMNGKASKIRRIFILKPDKSLRPLGIPTIEDRAKQMLMKIVLEPEWEARFETNSYGFRPGYSTSDAKWCIARQLQGGAKYFLDADIEKCFDNIDHTYLINKLNTSNMFKEQITSWLKAGIMSYSNDLSSEVNDSGTPQGGILSPLLMNIALHGMENYVTENFDKNQIKVVRYADDFVIFGKTLSNVQKAKTLVVEFLKPIGLNLSEKKTRIGHSMEKLPDTTGPIGLDFLSYNFRNIKCSKNRGVKNTRGTPQTFKLVTKPSKNSIDRHKKALSQILVKYKGAPLGRVIEKLANRIRGWTWYHSVSQSTVTFSKMDEWFWWKLWRWAKKRYKGANQAKQKCFNVKGWNFGYIQDNKTYILNRHDQTRVRKIVKIKPNASFYNGQIAYFAKRLSQENPRIKSLTNLFKKQNYSCSYCKMYLLPDDIVELHHSLDTEGTRTGEITFIHGHCHDQIHSTKSKKN